MSGKLLVSILTSQHVAKPLDTSIFSVDDVLATYTMLMKHKALLQNENCRAG